MKAQIEFDNGATLTFSPADLFFALPVETLTGYAENSFQATLTGGVVILNQADGGGSFGLAAPVAFADDGARLLVVNAAPQPADVRSDAGGGFGGNVGTNTATLAGRTGCLLLVAAGGAWHVAKSDGASFWQGE